MNRTDRLYALVEELRAAAPGHRSTTWLAGGIAHSEGNYPNDAVFMVQVDDVGAALAAAAEHGGSVVAEQQSTPFGLTFGYAANPDGSVFGVWCPPAE